MLGMKTGWTPLMIAAHHNSNVEVLHSLIDNGADVDARNHSGATALMLAASHSSHPGVLELLP